MLPIKIAKNIITFENFKCQLFHDIVKKAFCLKSVKKLIEKNHKANLMTNKLKVYKEKEFENAFFGVDREQKCKLKALFV